MPIYESAIMVTGVYVIVSYINNTFIDRVLYTNKRWNGFLSSEIDTTKTVYIIVHGQTHLFDKVQLSLISKGFERARIQRATLDKAGQRGEYVAMAWPPMAPKEIVLSEIIGPAADTDRSSVLGAWATVEQKELHRIRLE
jgi:hypothetical protein